MKVPLIKEGLKAVKTLTEENINTNVTLCFSPMQALIAAKAGAAGNRFGSIGTRGSSDAITATGVAVARS